MKLLALFLLLTLVISTIASDEPMRIGCFKHRVEAYFTGRVRDGAYECEFEHKQYPTPISFLFLVTKRLGRTNMFYEGSRLQTMKKVSLDIPGPFCPTHGRPLHLTGCTRLESLYCEVSHDHNAVQHQMWYSCASVKPWSALE
jgi:hypothetical protein